MKLERIFSPLEIIEIKQAVGDDGRFSGYVSTHDLDRQNDVILPGAFSSALEKHKSEDSLPAMLWHHQLDQPIGRWVSMTVDQHGLFAEGQLTLAVRKAQEAKALLVDGAAYFSIGFTLATNGSFEKDGVRYIREIDRLHEASVVSIPANPFARLAEKQRPGSRKDFEHLLRNFGGLTARESKRIAAVGWRGLVRDEQAIDVDALKYVVERLDKFERLITEKFQ